MGYGAWDDTHYNTAASFRATHGIDDFAYSRTASKVHDDLDPHGVTIRESRDSDEHPNSTPIVVLFDVTGSMGTVPRVMQKRLPELHGLLTRKGYTTDAQIMFGAIGDADCDRAPLQVGQFESDTTMDDQLRNVWLEGGGGGQKTESYELAAHFITHHTDTDAWNRRGKKGYLFVIGDEMSKPTLRARVLRDVLGGTYAEQATDIPTEQVWAAVQEKWEVFYILPRQTAYYDDPQVNQHWRDLLGERFLKLEDPDAVCDLIALTIGMFEDTIDLDEGLDDLVAIGSTHGQAVSKALAMVGSTSNRPASTGALPDDLTGPTDLA